MKRPFGVLVLAGLLMAPPAHSDRLTSLSRWAVQFSGDQGSTPAAPPEMLVLDPDRPETLSSEGSIRLRLAYLSVGEAQDQRPYWAHISSAAFLVEQDKELEGNVRVDFRDAAWQRILLEEEIPRVLAEGYQGFMLDTLDSIPYLEDRNPEKFGGSREALAQWLAKLRRAYPRLVLLASGSEALEIAAPYVNGYVAEGLFTAWDPASRRARRTTPEEMDEHLDFVGNALTLATRPVFTIDYAETGKPELARWAAVESAKRGYRPFVEIR